MENLREINIIKTPTYAEMAGPKGKFWIKYNFRPDGKIKLVEALKWGGLNKPAVASVRVPFGLTESEFLDSAYMRNLLDQVTAKKLA